MFLMIFIQIIRIILIVMTGYYVYKHNYKVILPAIAVFLLTFLLFLLNKVFHLTIDTFGSILYIVVIFMSLFLGSALRLYDRYAWWDRVIHFLSGVVFISFGIAILNRAGDLGKFSILFFSFAFSNTLHIWWEIGEYISDYFFHTDHQRWQKHNKTVNHLPKNAIQPAGLVDTMNDILLCNAGSIAACVVWWFIM